MHIDQKQLVRPITEHDRTQLASLLHFSTFVHRHLDWRTPMDWIGRPPFYGLESNQRIISSLSCSPDIPDVTWIRAFVCDSSINPPNAWGPLWSETLNDLNDQKIKIVAAIPIQKWFREILERAHFERLHNIVTLAWDQTPDESRTGYTEAPIKPMQSSDLERIREIDQAAFDPLWQHSTDLIELAYAQSNYATVFLHNGEIIGYQISTPTRYGVHLGRLAVHPKAQKKGVGTALVRDLQKKFNESGPIRISVNTHDTNTASLALYYKAGFTKTSESYPVYQYFL
jgi:ribosomal-protein-alanine N-acetyltransferase